MLWIIQNTWYMMNKRTIILLAILCTSRTLAWIPSQQKTSPTCSAIVLFATVSPRIDFQSDAQRFGRGEMHLSALLEEKDVVVIQSGSWYVDGVQVGDGPIQYEYCTVESLQIVWTHNCEHGVIRGYSVLPGEEDDKDVLHLHVDPTWDPIEFGPEQLVARLPVDWVNETTCKLRVPWNEEFRNKMQDFFL